MVHGELWATLSLAAVGLETGLRSEPNEAGFALREGETGETGEVDEAKIVPEKMGSGEVAMRRAAAPEVVAYEGRWRCCR